jgi:tRNA pseudouridine55 synthase
MRRFAGTRKVGHLGTLDPSATGVLPLVIGRATRLAQFYKGNEKTYEGTIRFGFSTDSYDAEGEPTSSIQLVMFSSSEVDAALQPSRGRFAQMPPAVSAKKIAGRPAYELARKNLPVELKAVDIEVYAIDILDVATVDGSTEARVRVRCSAGTYLRSIAHDAGRVLGCGAHLKALRRIASGEFRIEQARTLEQFAELSTAGRFSEAVIPSAQLLTQFPTELVDELTIGQIRNGRDFRVSPFVERGEARYVKAVASDGELVAIGEAVLPNLYHPVLVM